MCEGTGASAGADDSEPAAATEVMTSRGCEGGSSSRPAASCPDSPSLKVCNLGKEPCHPSAQQSGVQLAWLSSHFGHRSQGFISVCGISPATTDLLGAAWCLEAVQTQVSVKHIGKKGSCICKFKYWSQLSPCYELVQMCEQEARAGAPAGPDSDQPAATAETVQANCAEGGARGSLVASPSDSPLLTVDNPPPCVQSSVAFCLLNLRTRHSTAVRLVPLMDSRNSCSFTVLLCPCLMMWYHLRAAVYVLVLAATHPDSITKHCGTK